MNESISFVGGMRSQESGSDEIDKPGLENHFWGLRFMAIVGANRNGIERADALEQDGGGIDRGTSVH
jgi:hypothetical protein